MWHSVDQFRGVRAQTYYTSGLTAADFGSKLQGTYIISSRNVQKSVLTGASYPKIEGLWTRIVLMARFPKRDPLKVATVRRKHPQVTTYELSSVTCPLLWHFLLPRRSSRCCSLTPHPSSVMFLFQAIIMLGSWSPCPSSVLVHLLTKRGRGKGRDTLWIMQLPQVYFSDSIMAKQPDLLLTLRFVYPYQGDDSFL